VRYRRQRGPALRGGSELAVVQIAAAANADVHIGAPTALCDAIAAALPDARAGGTTRSHRRNDQRLMSKTLRGTSTCITALSPIRLPRVRRSRH
jgi:hypothetical protein